MSWKFMCMCKARLPQYFWQHRVSSDNAKRDICKSPDDYVIKSKLFYPICFLIHCSAFGPIAYYKGTNIIDSCRVNITQSLIYFKTNVSNGWITQTSIFFFCGFWVWSWFPLQWSIAWPVERLMHCPWKRNHSSNALSLPCFTAIDFQRGDQYLFMIHVGSVTSCPPLRLSAKRF